MNLSKAKKVVILVLVILNAVLLVLRITDTPDYKLSSAREKAVYQVLGQNNIALYTDLLTTYKPMKQIYVSSIETDIGKILPAFFDDTSSIHMTIEFSKTVYTDSYKTLTLGENSLIFEDKSDFSSSGEISLSNATKIATAFSGVVKAALSFSDTLELEKYTFGGNEYTFSFVESYDGNKIFSNYINITVRNGKVVLVEASRYGIDGFRGEEKTIAAPDEVMLTLLYELNESDSAYGKIITDMEIGYDFSQAGDISSGESLSLVPCYRIHIQGIDEPYTINAYTNEIM